MPSSIQIVPKWTFPHVETFIYDNTETTEVSAAETDDSYKTIHVFRSARGIDNKVIKKTNLKSHVNTFGKTDYNRFGQPLMMPVASLETELVTTFEMRIMPEDATYANIGLVAYYRTGNADVSVPVLDENGDQEYDTDGITPKTKIENRPMFQVVFRAFSNAPTIYPATNRLVESNTSGIHSSAEMDAFIKRCANNLPAIDEDGEGWKAVPIMYFRVMGRGIYGNNYKFRITNNAEYEKDYEKMIYTFEVFDTDNDEYTSYVGNMVTALINNKSTFINDVIEDYAMGDYPADIHVYEEGVDVLYDAYKNFLTDLSLTSGLAITIPDEDEFDLFFGKYVGSTNKYENYQVVISTDSIYPVADDANKVVLSDVLGTSFSGGYDGSFSKFIDPTTNTSIEGAKEKITPAMLKNANKKGITYLSSTECTVEDYVYALAFNGYLDKAILSTRRVPSDYYLDANYSYYTKMSLALFAIARNDAVCYIDTGIDIDTFSSTVMTMLKRKYNIAPFTNRLISINTHSWKVPDPFTGRKFRVTPTYYIASNLPIHWNNYGRQQPFAKSYAIISNISRGSMIPSIDLYEADLMETLTNMRINYTEAIDEDLYQRGIQNTAQSKNSDLLEESNMHCLMWFKKNLEKDVYDSLYNFANAADRTTFKNYEESKYAYLKGGVFSSFSINFDMNAWENERCIIHCYAEVVFRTINKRAIIEIDVNRRSLTD